MTDSGHEIWAPYEIFYIHGMLFNTTSAVQSLIVLSDILGSKAVLGVRDDEVLDHLQNVILQAGAISKYCFPPTQAGNRAEARAALIRIALGITDASPLKNRQLRNSLEHFEERLDKYLANGIVGRICPQYVGQELRRDAVPSHIFRAYYIDSDTFELLGVRYSFGPIANAIFLVHRELQRCDRDGGRLAPRTRKMGA